MSGFCDMADAPRTGHIILWLGECIPEVPYVRTGCFISAEEARRSELEWPTGADGWLIWAEDAEDWYYVGLGEPNGWLPLPGSSASQASRTFPREKQS